jgi:FkbM family methyltransferase
VDIGANRGDRAGRFMKEYPNAKVHCVEPVPELANLVRQRYRHPRCQVHEIAMTASSGQADMTRQDTCGLFTLKESAETHAEESALRLSVVTQTLDNFCLHEHLATIDYLKIDAGGSDLEVLHGARSLLDRSCIAVIEVEAGVNPDATIFSTLESMKTYLESHRYRVFAFYEQVAEWPTHQPQLRRVNCVFIAPRLQMAASPRPMSLS